MELRGRTPSRGPRQRHTKSCSIELPMANCHQIRRRPTSKSPHEFVAVVESAPCFRCPSTYWLASRPDRGLPSNHEERGLGRLSILLPRFCGSQEIRPHTTFYARRP